MKKPIKNKLEKLNSSYHYEDGNVHIVRTQNVQPILEENHNLRDIMPSSHGQASWRLAGRIPMVVATQWAKECGSSVGTPEWGEYCKKKMMDGEFAKLRIKGY